MAKVDRNTIQNDLNESNALEHELSLDEAYRDLDAFEKYDEPEYNHCDNYYDDYDWREDAFYGDDLNDGEYLSDY